MQELPSFKKFVTENRFVVGHDDREFKETNIDDAIVFIQKNEIQVFVLINTSLNEEQAIKLTSLLSNPSLKEFAVSGKHLGDNFIKAIAEALAKYPYLTTLNIYCPELTNNGLIKLGNILQMKNCPLKHLYVHAGKTSVIGASHFMYDLMRKKINVDGTHAIELDSSLFNYKGVITTDHVTANEYLSMLSDLYLIINGHHMGVIISGINPQTELDQIFKYINTILDGITDEQSKQLFGEVNKSSLKVPAIVPPLRSLCMRYLVNKGIFSQASNCSLVDLGQNCNDEIEHKRDIFKSLLCSWRNNDQTPLDVKLNNIDLAIKLGCHVDATSANGWTQLMWACRFNNLPVVRRLIQCGANVTFIAIDGETPLSQSFDEDVIIFIIENIAEKNEQESKSSAHLKSP